MPSLSRRSRRQSGQTPRLPQLPRPRLGRRRPLASLPRLQESGNKSSKDRFINLFVLHCNSVEGKKLKDEIISNFSNSDALSSMTPDEMVKLYLTTELANIEELCEGYEDAILSFGLVCRIKEPPFSAGRAS